MKGVPSLTQYTFFIQERDLPTQDTSIHITFIYIMIGYKSTNSKCIIQGGTTFHVLSPPFMSVN